MTILYYTANKISEFFANNIRDHLFKHSQELSIPIISISHKPIDFGHNICVGDIGASSYNIYKQILIGAKEAKTKYVVCCEDDTLYTTDHFTYRPTADDVFSYNVHRWNLDINGTFFYRNRAGMCMCIAPTDLMIKTLELRFEKFPNPIPQREAVGFGEPGRYEKYLGLPSVRMERFKSKVPTVTFSHRPSLGGRRKIGGSDILVTDLKPYGDGANLWKEVHG